MFAYRAYIAYVEQRVVADVALHSQRKVHHARDLRVRVHAGDTTVATLGERDAFGELSALDPELRSASVTAVDDTRLLCLDHEQLFELMSERIEVGRGIIRFLCRRYRGSVELAQKRWRDSEGQSLVPPPPFQTLLGPLESEGIPKRSGNSPIQIERGTSPKQARP